LKNAIALNCAQPSRSSRSVDAMEEFLTLRSRRPGSSADSTVCHSHRIVDGKRTENSVLTHAQQYGSASETSPLATHDISRVSYHVKHLESFAEALQDVSRALFVTQAPGRVS
jgi:hypothetical protein